jgi:hypothetical protein
MSENEKNPTQSGQDIENLLADFSRQKQEHTDNFGTPEPPEKGENIAAEEKTFSENNAPRIKAEKAKKKKAPAYYHRRRNRRGCYSFGHYRRRCVFKNRVFKALSAAVSRCEIPDGIRKEYCEQYACKPAPAV